MQLSSAAAVQQSSGRSVVLLSGLFTLLYFSEGLPYGVVTELFPIYLRQAGVSLTQIGFLATIWLVWTLKLFWAPMVDAFGTYQRWITGALLLIVSALIIFSVTDLTHSLWLWVVLVALAFGSATQDIAVDAYTIAATPQRFLGVVNAVRITAYRVALMLAGGGLAVIATRSSWSAAFGVAAGVAFALFLLSFALPPQQQQVERRPRSSLLADLREWANRPHAAAVLGVVFLYRLSDATLLTMIKPFWVDRGYSAAEIGNVTTTIGVLFTILGGVAGGVFITRYGIYWSLVWMGVLQILSNVGYAWAAMSDAGRPTIYAAAVIEAFTTGLGTAAFLSFLMAICDRSRAATEFALLTGMYNLSRAIIGTASGWSAQQLGYAGYFWLTVAAGIPGLLLLPYIKERLKSSNT